MKSSPEHRLGLIAREAEKISRQLSDLELVPVGEISRRWKKSKRWITEHLPVIKLGPKTHRVRLRDALEFQQKRVLRP